LITRIGYVDERTVTTTVHLRVGTRNEDLRS